MPLVRKYIKTVQEELVAGCCTRLCVLHGEFLFRNLIGRYLTKIENDNAIKSYFEAEKIKKERKSIPTQ